MDTAEADLLFMEEVFQRCLIIIPCLLDYHSHRIPVHYDKRHLVFLCLCYILASCCCQLSSVMTQDCLEGPLVASGRVRYVEAQSPTLHTPGDVSQGEYYKKRCIQRCFHIRLQVCVILMFSVRLMAQYLRRKHI